jgi:hypothetical protein
MCKEPVPYGHDEREARARTPHYNEADDSFVVKIKCDNAIWARGVVYVTYYKARACVSACNVGIFVCAAVTSLR